MFDEDATVKKNWTKAWEEGGGAYKKANPVKEEMGLRLEEHIIPEIVGEIVRGLQDVSWSIRRR